MGGGAGVAEVRREAASAERHALLAGRCLALRDLLLARRARRVGEEGEHGGPAARGDRQGLVQQAAGEEHRPAGGGLVEVAAELGEAELAATATTARPTPPTAASR